MTTNFDININLSHTIFGEAIGFMNGLKQNKLLSAGLKKNAQRILK